MRKRGIITGIRKPLYFNAANFERIKQLYPEPNLSEIVNKSMAYILSQPDQWIRDFLARQNTSYFPKI